MDSTGYSGTPLYRKLGVKDGHSFAWLDAPDDFDATLGALPGRYEALTRVSGYGSWLNFYLCDFDGRIVLPKTKQVFTPDLHVARARCGA